MNITRLVRSTAILLMIALRPPAAPAGDWPQWLGESRNCSTGETVIPWKEPPAVVWRQPAGEGHSSPVVANGRVFTFAKVADKEEEDLVARDADTGKELWRTSYPRARFASPFGNGPRATPSVSHGHVYTFGATGVLTCFRFDTGAKLWQVDTLKEFHAPNLFFGMSGSPLVADDKVYVNVGAKSASIVAFDAATGAVAWKSLSDPASYASPILLGRQPRQLIFFTQQGLASLNPADGSVYWKYPVVDLLSESSTTPVRVADMLVASSVTYGSVALGLEPKDGKPAASRVWRNDQLNCYFSTPVAVKDTLYMVTGKALPPPSATLRAVDIKTGKVLWDRPTIGKYHATMIRTGDDKLLLLDDGGTLKLLDPDPAGYKELASSKVCGETWAHPALSNGRLYVRDKSELICLQLGR